MDWFWYILERFQSFIVIRHSSPFFLRGDIPTTRHSSTNHLQWGLSAALGARRAGADVMLLERYGCFGGVVKLEKYNHSGVYLLRIPEGYFLSWLEEMENFRRVLHFVGVQQKMILVSETGREHDIAMVRGWVPHWWPARDWDNLFPKLPCWLAIQITPFLTKLQRKKRRLLDVYICHWCTIIRDGHSSSIRAFGTCPKHTGIVYDAGMSIKAIVVVFFENWNVGVWMRSPSYWGILFVFFLTKTRGNEVVT